MRRFRRMLALVTVLAILSSAQPGLAIDGVWHKPYGIDDLYIIESTERSPRDPMATETVNIKITTWPVESGQAAWVSWTKNGVAQTDIGASWQYNSGNNSYWQASMGPFSKGDQITYYVHANKDGTNQKTVGPFSFTVTAWDRVENITGYSNPGNRVELSATSQSGQHSPKISISFTAADTYRIQMAPNPGSVTFATGLSNYTVTDLGSTIRIATSAIQLDVQKSPYRLTVKRADGTVVTENIDPNLHWNMSWLSNGSGVVDQVADWFNSPTSEKFIGFGERFNSLVKRGEDVDIYVYDKYRDQQEKSYLPIPFYISTAGYGVYVNSTYHTKFRLNTERTDMAGWATRTGGTSGGMLDYYLMVGEPKTVLDRYTAITARPTVPPKWAFGPIMSANEWNTDAEVRDQISKMNTYDIPHTMMVLEQWSDEMTFYIFGGATFTPKAATWTPTLSDFTFGSQFPDPAGLVTHLHNNGVKVLLWQAPINKYPQSEDYANRYANSITQNRTDDDYMVAQGYAVGDGNGGVYRVPTGLWFPGSTVPDFTSATATTWWMSKREYLFDEVGIDGVKTDGGENIWERTTTFSDGSKKLEMRNRFPMEYIGAFNGFVQSKTSNDGITFARSGAAGVQQYPLHWSGDQESTWPAFQSQVKAALSAGASGIPFAGWDLAGFSGSLPTVELYKRSAAAAALSPMMQFHSEGANPSPSLARSPWNMADQSGDSTARTTYRKWANTRMNLLPYIYSEAVASGNTGAPLMRAMLLEFPSDSATHDLWDQWMLGSNLLVAPVVTQGATSRSVYLPAGEWVDLIWGGIERGAKTKTYGANADEMPIYARGGAVIPMNLNSSYELGGSIGNSTTSYTNLTFAIYPYGESTYDFYENRGATAKTFSVSEEYDKHQVSVTWPALSTSSTLRIHTGAPTGVTVGGAAVTSVASLADLNSASAGYYYDSATQFLYVKQPGAGSARSLVVSGTDKPAFEAEFGTLVNTGTNTDHAGYTGTGFVDQFASAGDSAEISVSVRKKGTYRLDLRYSAGSGTATRALYVNGGKRYNTVSLPGTANWDTWATASTLVSLTPGEHKIKVAYESDNTQAINLDHLKLVAVEAPAREMYQEEAMIGNNYSVGMLDARATLYDFMYPLGIHQGVVVDGSDANGTSGVQVNVNQAVVGLEVNGAQHWISDPDLWVHTQQYVTDTATLLSVATHKSLPLKVTQYDFAPRGITYPNNGSSQPIRGIYLKRVIVENTGGSPQTVGVTYYADMNVNGEGYNDTISYDGTDDALYVTDGGGYGGRNRTISFAVKMKSTGSVSGSSNQTYPDGAGYLKKTATIGAGSSQEFDVMMVGATSQTTGANLYASDLKPALDWFATANIATVQSDTATNWSNLLSSATSIEAPDPKYSQNLRRSLIISVLHFDLSTGAMAAGFHNGAYAYNWPRDTVFGALTLDRAGIHDIPAAAYNWLWNTAERDTSTNDIGNDGVFYRFWYQKYTMDGKREWEQPQVDETAIIPIGVLYHYKRTGDTSFRNTYYPMAREAAWVSSEDNPHAGMDFNENMRLMFSMSIWEDMWGMFLYTNANVVAGLKAAKALADMEGDTANATLFQNRADDILNNGILPSISSSDTVNPGMYDQDHNRFFFSKDLKRWYTDASNLWNAITADISMLGISYPFDVLAANDTKVVNTAAEIEAALTELAETGSAYGGVVRYRQDQVSRYGNAYADFGDTYFDGGPWMMATTWLSLYKLQLAQTKTGRSDVDKAKEYLDWVLTYTGTLGVGSEQVDETKSPGQFAKQAAWGNVWESNGSIVDNIYGFLDYDYDAPSSTLTVKPKLPTAWSYLGGNIALPTGKFYVKQTRVSATQDEVILTNNTSGTQTVDIYIQTDANPTSVTGNGSLTWTYDPANGRVRIQGSMTASQSLTITINH